MNIEQVFHNTVDSLHQHLMQVDKSSSKKPGELLLTGFIEETKKKNEEINQIQTRIKFLTEILELKQKINSQSSSHIEILKNQLNQLKQEASEVVPLTFNLSPVPKLTISQPPNPELKEKEDFLKDLTECFNYQVCLSCLYAKRNGEVS